MKKILLTIGFFSLAHASAQTTIFQEDWDGMGPGISAWTRYNVDGLTPVGPTGINGEPLSYLVQDAWSVLSLAQIITTTPGYVYPTAATGMAGNIIASNSWYDPAGTANDWLVSPQISIPAGATNVNLTWSATSRGNATFLEDYKVYISTTGNQVANFTTLLLNVPNELNTGSARSVNISSYAGQNVRIAFRNDGNDQYVMFLDNIKIAGNNILGTSESAKSSIGVYPNPTKGKVYIKSEKKIKSTSLLDLSGKIILSGNTENIDMTALVKGTYILQVEFADGSKTNEKVIKD